MPQSGGPSHRSRRANRETAVELLEGFLAELEQRIAGQRETWSKNQDQELSILARQISEAVRGVNGPPTALASQLDAMALAEDAEIIELFEKLEALTRLCREASVDRADWELES
jgi:hypothetical protein